VKGMGGQARVVRSLISGNHLNGVLVREDSTLQLQECEVLNNLGFGIATKVPPPPFLLENKRNTSRIQSMDGSCLLSFVVLGGVPTDASAKHAACEPRV